MRYFSFNFWKKSFLFFVPNSNVAHLLKLIVFADDKSISTQVMGFI